jgi:hypothetical protein
MILDGVVETISHPLSDALVDKDKGQDTQYLQYHCRDEQCVVLYGILVDHKAQNAQQKDDDAYILKKVFHTITRY